MTYRLTISTFFRSCPDAEHYYGTIRRKGLGPVNSETVKEIQRCETSEEVIRKADAWAREKGYALEIDLLVKHV